MITALVSSCAADAGAGAEYTVRDSLGVEIVENVSGSWTDDTRWRLSHEPVVDIGVFEGAPEYQLFRVRDALRLSNGWIVVANAGTHEIRFYESDGTYIGSTGREGSGPGEFENLAMLRPFPGDSLLAYDFSHARASIFATDGTFGRSYSVVPPTEGGFGFATDALADGTLMVRSLSLFQGDFSDGLQRRDEDHYTISTEGEFLDSVGTFPGQESFIQTARDGGNFMVGIRSAPFGRQTVLATHGKQFCVGSADTYEIQCRESDGTLVRIVRRSRPNQRVTAEDLDALKQQELAEADDDNSRRNIEQMYSDIPVPETMPAYDDLEIDAAGNMWVREYSWIEGAERVWTVFDRDGRMSGQITTPANFAITEIGEDYMLGIWRDEFDVEHVRLYDLLKWTT